MDASIIIVNWNTRNRLRDCLNSIYQWTESIEYEVIVIDNASEDGSPQMVRTEFPEVRLIQNQKNVGFAAANNQGITVANGRYVLLLNSDTIILQNAIPKTVEFADARPEAAVVGCHVQNHDQTTQPSTFMFPSLLNMVLFTTYLYRLFPKSKLFGRERMTWWDRTNAREVDVVTGCFMLVRRKAIEQVGLMDEQFFMYGEETDWCYRFRNAGWKTLFTPEAEIIHFGGASSKQKKYEMALQLRASILLFFRKHKCRLSYSLACLLVALFFLLRLPYWLLRATFVSKTRRMDLQTTKTYIAGLFRAFCGWRGFCLRK